MAGLDDLIKQALETILKSVDLEATSENKGPEKSAPTPRYRGNEVSALLKLSASAGKGKQYDVALTHLEKVLALDPSNAQARLQIAKVLQEKGYRFRAMMVAAMPLTQSTSATLRCKAYTSLGDLVMGWGCQGKDVEEADWFFHMAQSENCQDFLPVWNLLELYLRAALAAESEPLRAHYLEMAQQHAEIVLEWSLNPRGNLTTHLLPGLEDLRESFPKTAEWQALYSQLRRNALKPCVEPEKEIDTPVPVRIATSEPASAWKPSRLVALWGAILVLVLGIIWNSLGVLAKLPNANQPQAPAPPGSPPNPGLSSVDAPRPPSLPRSSAHPRGQLRLVRSYDWGELGFQPQHDAPGIWMARAYDWDELILG